MSRLELPVRRLAVLASLTAMIASGYFAIGHRAIHLQSTWSCSTATWLDGRIPFIPWFIFVYLSMWGLWWVPAFRATPTGFRRFAASAAACNAIALLIFLACQDHYTRQSVAGMARSLRVLYEALYRIDPPRNTFPSLHAVNTMLVLRYVVRQQGGHWYVAWGTLVVLASVLTKQHVIADVVAGGVLAYVVDVVVRSSARHSRDRRM